MLAAWEIKPEFSPAPAGWLARLLARLQVRLQVPLPARLPARLLAPLSAGPLACNFDAGDVHAI
jgi:hypothetical protein